MKFFAAFKNFARRSTVCFFLILALIFIITAFSNLRLALQKMRDERCDGLQNTVERTGSYLQYRMERAQISAETIRNALRNILVEKSGLAEQLEEYKNITQLMMEVIDEDVVSYYRIYVDKEKIYSNQRTSAYFLNNLEKFHEWAKNVAASQIWWQETNTQKYSISMKEEQVISYICPIISQKDFKQLNGVVVADVRIEELQDVLYSGEENGIFLVNSGGKILASWNNQRIGEAYISPEQAVEMKELSSGRLAVGKTIYLFHKLENTDWYLMTAADVTQINLFNKDIIFTLLSLIFAVMSAAFGFLLSQNNIRLRKNVSRIYQVVEGMQDEDSYENNDGEDEGQPPKWEVGMDLDKETEQIISTVAHVMEERYRNQIIMADYQMKALQSQINPHFLYNTLDAVKWIILDRRIEDGVEMLNELSRFIRYGFTKGSSIVKLSEEIAHIQAYLKLMQKRFPEEFTTSYETEEIGENCYIPKFTLQPLVENALLHGILPYKKKICHIVIRSWREEDYYGVEIEDNGKGMSEETVSNLLNQKKENVKSYGIYNVYERLRIYSKGQCRFHITSKENTGTCVSIELPYRNKTEAGKK